MIRVDRKPGVRLVTDPAPKGPTAAEQVEAFRKQLDRGVDRAAVEKLSDEDAQRAFDILTRAGL